jgi:hypothetical protein
MYYPGAVCGAVGFQWCHLCLLAPSQHGYSTGVADASFMVIERLFAEIPSGALALWRTAIVRAIVAIRGALLAR